MDVAYHPAAREELAGLPKAERLAVLHAAEKLQALGEQLPFPHCSALRQSAYRSFALVAAEVPGGPFIDEVVT